MSVIVIDGNMPTDYDSCWYLDCKCWKECFINGKQYNCPLRPLPEKHGGLVDVDAIIAELKDGDFESGVKASGADLVVAILLAYLNSKPIIVEAEGD